VISDFGQDWGDGPEQFGWVTGIALDSANNLYIADAHRNRVLVYNKSRILVRQLGVTDEEGQDNLHFRWPFCITLDKSGNLYVSDYGNYRVQKFEKTGKFIKTFGTGLQGDEIDRMASPVDVAVDPTGNVFVADETNNRVQVFSATGAYLTTLAGNYGKDGGVWKLCPTTAKCS
jgi:DNA-binding beta-propeller fold protein YncE